MYLETAQPNQIEKAGGVAASTSADREDGASNICHIGKRNGKSMFHRFQQLPCELRLMIWKAAMTPRLVAIKSRPCPKDLDDARNRKNREISLIRGIPALLAVNQEARHCALRHYTWRFTIDITIREMDDWGEVVENCQRARVVMSPKDTFGLFRCKQEWREGLSISKFRVKIAKDKRSPWRIYETTDAPREQQLVHRFKKVAILKYAIEPNLHIVRALNVTLWNLNSILHAASAGFRTALSAHTKNKILVESANVSRSAIQAFLSPPGDHLLPPMDENAQIPDMLAYELEEGEKGEDDFDEFLSMLS